MSTCDTSNKMSAWYQNYRSWISWTHWTECRWRRLCWIIRSIVGSNHLYKSVLSTNTDDALTVRRVKERKSEGQSRWRTVTFLLLYILSCRSPDVCDVLFFNRNKMSQNSLWIRVMDLPGNMTHFLLYIYHIYFQSNVIAQLFSSPSCRWLIE
jgi:hypothetical protein